MISSTTSASLNPYWWSYLSYLKRLNGNTSSVFSCSKTGTIYLSTLLKQFFSATDSFQGLLFNFYLASLLKYYCKIYSSFFLQFNLFNDFPSSNPFYLGKRTFLSDVPKDASFFDLMLDKHEPVQLLYSLANLIYLKAFSISIYHSSTLLISKSTSIHHFLTFIYYWI